MVDYKEKYEQLARDNSLLRAEIAELKRLATDDVTVAYSRLQMRADRQRKYLDTLNRRVTSQRMRLRKLSELGRDLTREEYLAAKAELHEQTQERIEEFAQV